MASPSSTTILRTIIRLQAGFAVVIGLVVMIGWKLDLEGLLRLRATFPPMPFNTALWLALSGVALGATTARAWQRLEKLLGALVLGMALATLSEYAFGVDLRIDELFQRADLVRWPQNPGRPAANTAAAFVLAAGALLLHARPMSVVRAVAIGLNGSGVVALASISLFAHTLAVHEDLPWLGGGQAMAVHTSAGLLFIGLGQAELAWFVSDRALPPRWVPFSVGLLGCLATVVLWQSVVRAERLQVTQLVDEQALAVRDGLARRLTERVQALGRMAHRWEVSGAPTETAWRADAALYQAHASDYRALAWFDEQGGLRWVEPDPGVGGPRPLDLATDPVRRAAFDRANRTHEPAVTPIVDLAVGGRGFLVIIPIVRAGRSEGAIVGLFRVAPFMAGLLPRDGDVSVELFDGASRAYEHRVAETATSNAFTSAAVSVGAGTMWSVRTTPGSGSSTGNDPSCPPPCSARA